MNQSDKIDIGTELSQIKSFSVGMSSKDKGWTIGNSDLIRQVHNSFARQDPFTIEEDDRAAKDDDDCFHFVGYVPYGGQLYELDGLQGGPISFGECTDDNWLSLARDQIQTRIQKYAQSEIRFNLLALVQDKKEQAQKQLEEATAAGNQDLIQTLNLKIEQENEKQQKWKTENERRRHNYVPLIFELLQQLAKKN